MKDYTEAELNPYMACLGPFESLEYAGTFTPQAWRELARVLASESRSMEHAKRIVRGFMQLERLDERGYLRTSIPSSTEFLHFARSVPAQAVEVPGGVLPAACSECAPYGGHSRLVRRGELEGMARCTCARGAILRAMDVARGAA